MTTRIGELLIQAGKLEAPQLDRALRAQAETGERLGTLLVKLGFVAERDLADLLADILDVPVATEADYAELPDPDERVTVEFLRRSQAVPVDEDGMRISVAMTDPSDAFLLTALELAFGKPVIPLAGVSADIQAAIQRLQGRSGDSLADISDPLHADLDADLDDIEHLKDMASEAPVIRMVNHLIMQALKVRASDIHIEPFEGALTVRYRVDGMLREVEAPPAASAAAVISRIKVMANLNIAERRLPQDGRIKIRVEGREVDMRVSTVPIMHGESVVIRLLDQGGVPLDFVGLGFSGSNLTRLEALLDRPHGIILVTGPTGSGKTTTLYAALERINTPEKKILTVEDPVEYQLDGVNQIQIKPGIGLTFASALRSILRQDPDVIMIGEMRDTETARIAVQSALTGHKVLSTLHTNDAASSITRMLDMHVDDFLLTSTLDGALAQRLVRRLCPHCRQPYAPPAGVFDGMEDLGTGDSELLEFDDAGPPAAYGAPRVYHAMGCPECEHTGYWGRIGIVELLVMTPAIRKAVVERADAETIRQIAIREGMSTLREDGLRKALAGLTTLEEVERVTQADLEPA